ncbi:MAG: tetratricopeptide repeat protein [Bradymonadia bacterium]
MDTQTGHVIEATEVNFQTAVVAKSMEVPVLVQLFSPRSPQCPPLTVVLEALAAQYNGAFILARVNVDVSPQLAMAFGAQTVPMGIMIKEGRPVDAFQGAQSEANVRDFIARFVEAPNADPLVAGFEALEDKEYDRAAQCFQQVLESIPDSADALLGLARVALATNRLDEVPTIVDAIPPEHPKYDQGQRLKAVLAFAEDAGDLSQLTDAVQTNPKDVAAWYSLGATYAVEQNLPQAFDAFLKVVMLDREFREDAGRKSLLSLFEVAGTQSPDVLAARRKLASLLF